MCGEPPVRTLRVPLQFEGQILPKGLVSLLEAEPVRGTKQSPLLVMPTDLADTVETTHRILARRERSLHYVHVPTPNHLDDEAYYARLAGQPPAWRLRPPPWLHASRRRPAPHRGRATLAKRRSESLARFSAEWFMVEVPPRRTQSISLGDETRSRLARWSPERRVAPGIPIVTCWEAREDCSRFAQASLRAS